MNRFTASLSVVVFIAWCLACAGGVNPPSDPKQVVQAKKTEEPKHPGGKPIRDPIGDPEKPPKKEDSAPVRIKSFPTLFSEFRDNPVGADVNLKGRRVIVEKADDAEPDQRGDDLWFIVPIGQNNDLTPVYGVEFQLSDEGKKHVAAVLEEAKSTGVSPDGGDYELAGTVKGTRRYPANIFGGFIVTITDCSYVKKVKK